MGISEGPFQPVAQAAMAEESTPKRRGFNMGFLISSSQLIGATLTPLLVVAIAVRFDWHIAFYVVAIPGLIMAFLLGKFMKDRKGNVPDADGNVTSAGGKPEKGKTKEKLSWDEYAKVFKQRNVWLSIIISACFMTWLFAYSVFAP